MEEIWRNPGVESAIASLMTARPPNSESNPPEEGEQRTVTGESADESVGATLGRYKLLEKLGEGGCGVVYVAEQTQPVRRRVALKVIKLGMDTKSVVARFEAERQALAMMDHPNIAKVLDAGTTELGRPYFVMELVRGIRITDYCDQHKLGTREQLDLFIDVCHAIQHAHQKGVIHRDIKPSNILVTLHDGVPIPKVIDFGIAKATEGRLTDATVYTQLHQFIGTPAYMSPEQAEMSGLDIDTRSDIYSLGVLLYELLTGTTPFTTKELLDSGLDAMRKTIREKDPVRPSTRLTQLLVAADVRRLNSKSRICDSHSAIPSDLDWIVMKCLEKDRTRRYETANGLAADLKRHLNNEPVVARPPSAAYRLQKAVGRNKLAFGAAGAVGLAVLAGLGLALAGWRQAKAERDAAITARSEAESARAGEASQRQQAQSAQAREAELRSQAQAQELAARRRAYAADMNLVREALDASNLQRARALLDRQRPKPGELDLRGWEWRHLWQSCRGDARFKLAQQPHRVGFTGFARDGRLFAMDQAGTVNVWDVHQRRKADTLRPPPPDGGVWMLPNAGQGFMSVDGTRFAAVGREGDRRSITIWDTQSKEIVTVLPMEKLAVTAVALSPDNARLATFTHDEGVAVWEVASRKRLALLPVAVDELKWRGALRFSPDGSLLAIGNCNGHVRFVETTTFSETGSFEASPIRMPVMSLAFSPDGRYLAASTAFFEAEIALWDFQAKTNLPRLKGHRGFVASLAFSPDGKTLASASADQTIKLWDTGAWHAAATFIGHQDEVWSVNFSLDGKWLASGGKDGAVYLWDGHPQNLTRGRTMLPIGEGSFSVSPDGGTVLAFSQDSISVWDAASGRKTNAPPELAGTRAAFWSSSGEIFLGGTAPAQIKVWDAKNGNISSYPLRGNAAQPRFFHLPRAGAILAAHFEAGATVFTRWDTLSRKEVSSFTVDRKLGLFPGASLSISWDEQFFAAALDTHGFTVRSARTGEESAAFPPYGGTLQGVALFPGGQLLATANTAIPAIDIWDTRPRAKIATLRGHNMVIARIVISPDGKRLASSTLGQEAVKLWDTESWEETANLNSPEAIVTSLSFLPNGDLATTDTAKNLSLWRAPSWEEIAAIEAENAN